MNAFEVFAKKISHEEDPKAVLLVQPLKRLILKGWQEKVSAAQARGESRLTIFKSRVDDHFENGRVVHKPNGSEFTRICSIANQTEGALFGSSLLTQIAEEVKPCYLFANVLFECRDEVGQDDPEDTPEEMEEEKQILSDVLAILEDKITLGWEPDKEKYRGKIIEECPLCNRMTTYLESFHRSDAPVNKRAHWACTNCVSEMEDTYEIAECPFCREVCLEV